MKQCFKHRRITKKEVNAIKALHKGEADEYQQRLALGCICNKLCRSQDMLYVLNDREETAFLNGRGFVGNKLLQIINIPIGQLQLIDEAENTNE